MQIQRFLDPSVLGRLNGLDLIAKTVVDGFISGLHRSPDFGFSPEFAEYRAYYPGDDLRHVDWNVYARTERMYLKRYRGETNCQVNVLLDTSGSMQYTSHSVDKLEFAKSVFKSAGHIHYNASTGAVIFDPENVWHPPVQFATLARHLDLTHGDFLFV